MALAQSSRPFDLKLIPNSDGTGTEIYPRVLGYGPFFLYPNPPLCIRVLPKLVDDETIKCSKCRVSSDSVV